MSMELLIALIGIGGTLLGTLIASGLGFYSNYKNQKLIFKNDAQFLKLTKYEKICSLCNSKKATLELIGIYVDKLSNNELFIDAYQKFIQEINQDYGRNSAELRTLIMLYCTELLPQLDKTTQSINKFFIELSNNTRSFPMSPFILINQRVVEINKNLDRMISFLQEDIKNRVNL